MQLIVTPTNVKHAEELSNLGVAILVGENQYTTLCAADFTIDQIRYLKEVISSGIYVRVTRLFHSEQLQDLEKYLNELSNIGVDGVYFSDNAILELNFKHQYSFKLIYDSETLVTNSSMMNYYENNGVNEFVIAYEVSLETIKEIRKKFNGNIQLLIHGSNNIFNSRRKLVSNYFKIVEKEPNEQNKYEIYEKVSDKKMTIVEDNHGTQILSSEEFCLISQLNDIAQLKPSQMLINGYMKSTEYITEVTKIYLEALNNIDDQNKLNLLRNKIEALHVDSEILTAGNLYKKNVYTISDARKLEEEENSNESK